MRVAVIGSRSITDVPNLGEFIPKETTVIVSGGAKGVDTLAREYARKNGLEILEFLPDYARYGRGAPLRRNITIIENADFVLAIWDGKSRGTQFVVKKCREMGVKFQVVMTQEARERMKAEKEKADPEKAE